jgi:hypothetical protein
LWHGIHYAVQQLWLIVCFYYIGTMSKGILRSCGGWFDAAYPQVSIDDHHFTSLGVVIGSSCVDVCYEVKALKPRIQWHDCL